MADPKLVSNVKEENKCYLYKNMQEKALKDQFSEINTNFSILFDTDRLKASYVCDIPLISKAIFVYLGKLTLIDTSSDNAIL